MRFRDRREAAGRLAGRLSGYAGKNPLILAVPRGAVPMGRILAEQLDGDLDVVLAHKLGAPDQPELAIGSVDESGHVYLGAQASVLGVDEDYVRAEAERQVSLLRERRASYTRLRPATDPAGRIVIVVDDGIATGATMIAALRSVRAKEPAKLIAATAVAPPETLARLGDEADEVVCLYAPEGFYAVGQFFDDFSQVTDDDVARILSGRTALRGAGQGGGP